MKAIILCGGQGTRLRPVTNELPKPMLPLFGRPLLEHLLLLLRRNGITDCILTLHYLPDLIEQWFGDGSELGMHLTCLRESEPLGTGGSLRACRELLKGEEQVLVLAGDCVCDFDLSSAIEEHERSGAMATLLLYPAEERLDLGLVQTDEQGRVVQFVEKPNWSQVISDMANTGICLFRTAALDYLPAHTPCDLSLDLFPALLAAGETIQTQHPYGYWQDAGTPSALLAAARDALAGKVRLELSLPRRRGGVWSAEELPEDVEILAPCWIGAGVTLGKGCTIGPDTVLERGSSVGSRAVVQGSLVQGASIGEGAAAVSAILCRGSILQRGSVLGEHTMLGEDAVVEENAILHPGVKIWPKLTVPAGARLNASLTSGASRGQLQFEEGGVLSGIIGGELTPELLVTLGSILGSEGRVGLGSFGGAGSKALLRALSSGITAAGGTALLHDGTVFWSGAWFARTNSLPISLFLEQRGEQLRIHCFDQDGLPLKRSRQRRLEQALLREAVYRANPSQFGEEEHFRNTDDHWLRDAAAHANAVPMPRIPIAVSPNGMENRLLADALDRLGCHVIREETKKVPRLRIGSEGRLSAVDEDGQLIGGEQLLLLTLAILMERGERSLAVPASAPATAERLAEQFGGSILRLERDGMPARERYAAQPALWEPVHAACLIVGWMARTGQTLARLLLSLPACTVRSTEIPLKHGRGALMRAMAEHYPDAEHLPDGMRFTVGGGSVWLSPRLRASAVTIAAEAADAELAEELCAMAGELARELDGNNV